MPEQSTFRGVLEFFGQIGIYDVVLPFLLVFTIVFAILEKTKLFGIEKIGGADYTRKNLNAMTAFVVAFFVIASSRLVEVITQVSANMVILLLASILFLLLIGSFQKETAEGVYLEGFMKWAFVAVMFIGLLGIFLNAITTSAGESWLSVTLGWVGSFWTNEAVASIILIIVILAAFIYITGSQKGAKSAEKKS